jgi:hypothetical protein
MTQIDIVQKPWGLCDVLRDRATASPTLVLLFV